LDGGPEAPFRGLEGAIIEWIELACKAGHKTFYQGFGIRAQLFRRNTNHAIGSARTALSGPLFCD